MNTKYLTCVVSASILCFTILGCAHHDAASTSTSAGKQFNNPDLSSPDVCLSTFFKAVNVGDFATATKCVDGGGVSTSAFWSAVRENLKVRNARFSVADVHTQTKRDTANVTFSLGVANLSNADHKEHVIIDNAQFKRMGESWELMPNIDVKTDSIGATSIATLLAFPSYAPESGLGKMMDGEADSADAIAKERTLGLAILEYAQDYDGKCLLQPDTYLVDLIQYLPNHDPSSFESCTLGEYDGTSFALNKRYYGKPVSKDYATDSKTVMIYEGAKEKLVFHHNGKSALLFADGHAKLVTPEQSKDKNVVQWDP